MPDNRHNRNVVIFFYTFSGQRPANIISGFSKTMQWIYLAIAIMSEVIATSALKTTEGFTRWIPSLLVVIGYTSSFYFLSLTLRTIPLGVAYAIWSGVGIALLAMIGWIIYHQALNMAAIIGITLIIAGVIVLVLFSKTALD